MPFPNGFDMSMLVNPVVFCPATVLIGLGRGSNSFSAQFIKIKKMSHYKKIGYNINVLQQTACLVVKPITVGNFAFLFNCTPVGRTSDSMTVPT